MSPGEDQFLILLRAELATAIAALELRLVDRYATKNDTVLLADAFADHEKQDERRFETLSLKIDGLIVPSEDRIAQIADVRIEEKTKSAWALRSNKATIIYLVVGVLALLVAVAALYATYHHTH